MYVDFEKSNYEKNIASTYNNLTNKSSYVANLIDNSINQSSNFYEKPRSLPLHIYHNSSYRNEDDLYQRRPSASSVSCYPYPRNYYDNNSTNWRSHEIKREQLQQYEPQQLNLNIELNFLSQPLLSQNDLDDLLGYDLSFISNDSISTVKEHSDITNAYGNKKNVHRDLYGNERKKTSFNSESDNKSRDNNQGYNRRNKYKKSDVEFIPSLDAPSFQIKSTKRIDKEDVVKNETIEEKNKLEFKELANRAKTKHLKIKPRTATSCDDVIDEVTPNTKVTHNSNDDVLYEENHTVEREIIARPRDINVIVIDDDDSNDEISKEENTVRKTEPTSSQVVIGNSEKSVDITKKLVQEVLTDLLSSKTDMNNSVLSMLSQIIGMKLDETKNNDNKQMDNAINTPIKESNILSEDSNNDVEKSTSTSSKSGTIPECSFNNSLDIVNETSIMVNDQNATQSTITSLPVDSDPDSNSKLSVYYDKIKSKYIEKSKKRLEENFKEKISSTQDKTSNISKKCKSQINKIAESLDLKKLNQSSKKDAIKNTNRDDYIGKVTSCKLCEYSGSTLVKHYVSKHSDYECFVSRIPPENAERIKTGNIRLGNKFLNASCVVFNFQCYFCDKRLSIGCESWLNHVSAHTGEYRYLCLKCKSQSHSVSTCLQCNTKCEIKNNKTFEDSNLTGYMCSVCHYVQMRKKSMDWHIKTQHTQNEIAECLKFNIVFCNGNLMDLPATHMGKKKSDKIPLIVDEKKLGTETNHNSTPKKLELTRKEHKNIKKSKNVEKSSDISKTKKVKKTNCLTDVDKKIKKIMNNDKSVLTNEEIKDFTNTTLARSSDSDASTIVYDDWNAETSSLTITNSKNNDMNISTTKTRSEVNLDLLETHADTTGAQTNTDVASKSNSDSTKRTFLDVQKRSNREEDENEPSKKKSRLEKSHVHHVVDKVNNSISKSNKNIPNNKPSSLSSRSADKINELEKKLSETQTKLVSHMSGSVDGNSSKKCVDIMDKGSSKLDNIPSPRTYNFPLKLDIDESENKNKPNEQIISSIISESSKIAPLKEDSILDDISNKLDEMLSQERCVTPPFDLNQIGSIPPNDILKQEPNQDIENCEIKLEIYEIKSEITEQNHETYPIEFYKIQNISCNKQPTKAAQINDFICLFDRCHFSTKIIDSFENHLQEFHQSDTWEGYCYACEAQVKSEDINSLASEFDHLMSIHLKMRSIPVDSPNATIQMLTMRKLPGDSLSSTLTLPPKLLPNEMTRISNEIVPLPGASSNIQFTNCTHDTLNLTSYLKCKILSDKVQNRIANPPTTTIQMVPFENILDSPRAESNIQIKPWTHNSSKKKISMILKMINLKSLNKFFKCMAIECFFCSHCNLSFLSHLHEHESSIETNQPYLLLSRNQMLDVLSWLECSYCDHIADSCDLLVDHLLTIHGTSIYQCPYCFYRSAVASNIVIHWSMHHKNNQLSVVISENFAKKSDVSLADLTACQEVNVKPLKCNGKYFIRMLYC